ncbi:PIN domain-containing protein [Hydrogenophaga sp. R2]|uniref:PIN domain-containing protein n=1 Tax=Hydrogenophaga sp. R2 TaxID=3132827 RepID=UPI003CF4E395
MTPPLHYVLDTNAVVQSPEILASARRLKLLIPKAVLGELTARGREHIRSVVGTLINDALNAGAQIVEAPPHLQNELIASDRHAQRLSGADFDVARTAIGFAERGMPVCVVTLDRALSTFLQSRSIRSITPSEFLKEQETQSSDPVLLSSARSISSQQKRYMVLSALLGASVSLGATAAYSNAALLLSTISVWGTVSALLVLGVGLFWYRQRYRLSYGVFEFLVGVMMSIYVFLPKFDYSTLGVAHGLQVLAGLYVMVRGLDNVGNGLQGTKLEAAWNRLFGRS